MAKLPKVKETMLTRVCTECVFLKPLKTREFLSGGEHKIFTISKNCYCTITNMNLKSILLFIILNLKILHCCF